MANNFEVINIYLTPEYKKNLKDLAKKYRNIKTDLKPIIEKL